MQLCSSALAPCTACSQLVCLPFSRQGTSSCQAGQRTTPQSAAFGDHTGAWNDQQQQLSCGHQCVHTCRMLPWSWPVAEVASTSSALAFFSLLGMGPGFCSILPAGPCASRPASVSSLACRHGQGGHARVHQLTELTQLQPQQSDSWQPMLLQQVPEDALRQVCSGTR